MSEARLGRAELAFEHPDVQAVLRDNTELVNRTHLFVGFIGYKCRNIGACVEAEVQDEIPRKDLITSQWSALGIQAFFAVHGSVNQYDRPEESISLVKVDEHGRIIPGSLACVGIFDPRTRAVLQREPTFKRADLALVLEMLQRQETLPWEPKWPETDESPDPQMSIVASGPTLELMPPE